MMQWSYVSGRQMAGKIPDRGTVATFSKEQIKVVDESVAVAEEMVCNFYKMSASQWLRHRYDVKTFSELSPQEKVEGPFAQIVRYAGRGRELSLGSAVYDFYKICLQDPAILSALSTMKNFSLFPFMVYIMVHELVHIVRFAKFYQNFNAPDHEKKEEEKRVHQITRSVLSPYDITGMDDILKFYEKWGTTGAPVTVA